MDHIANNFHPITASGEENLSAGAVSDEGEVFPTQVGE